MSSRLDAALERWHCRRDGETLTGGMSRVQPARRRDGSAVVVKVLEPAAAIREARALAAFSDRASVGLIAVAEDLGALLLERLTPTDLTTEADPWRRIEVQARLAAALVVDDPGGVPLLDPPGWLDQLERQLVAVPELLSGSAVGRARSTIAALPAVDTLTHGDLHARNVHLDRDGRWRALDPAPLVGTVAHESHTVVVERDRLDELMTAGVVELRRRLEFFAEVAGCDRDLAIDLCQARAVSSALHEGGLGDPKGVVPGLGWVAESLRSRQP